jgi:ATP-dependent Clp protease ATP-binding subunit ClpX
MDLVLSTLSQRRRSVTANIKYLHSCSFCSKNQTQVRKLISGNGAFICDECVHLCMDVISPKESLSPSAERSLTPPEIVAYLDRHVIGQNLAKKTLAVAIYNHLKRIAHPVVDGVAIDKSNVLMIGSSGVGKTHMVSTLAKILDVPFAVVDATSLSQTGYVGLDPEECLTRLYQAAESDLQRAERGIVFVDEIDKIARKTGENASTTRDVSGEGVQQALLKIIEGNDVKFTPAGGRKNPNGEFVTINTRNILFILGGAFEGLSKIISARSQEKTSKIGFGSDLPTQHNANSFDLIKTVDNEDLIAYGLIPELIGRIPVVLPFEDLDQATLKRILVEPNNAIVKQFQKLFELEGIQLVFEDSSLDEIAQLVIAARTGARGLRRVMERLLINAQYDIPHLKSTNIKTITVTADNVVNNTEPLRE